MFVLRLEVVCPVVCGERGVVWLTEILLSLLPWAWEALTPTAGSRRRFCSLGPGSAKLQWAGNDSGQQRGQFLRRNLQSRTPRRPSVRSPASRVRRGFPGHRAPLSSRAEEPLNLRPPPLPAPQPPFGSSCSPPLPLVPQPAPAARLLGQRFRSNHATSLLQGLPWLPPARK